MTPGCPYNYDCESTDNCSYECLGHDEMDEERITDNQFFIICPWCGNRWYQEEKEPRKCNVCKQYCWEGTPEMHKFFPDLEAWTKYDSERIN